MTPGIRTNAAAEVLGVSPNTLRSWERRYGYPQPRRSPGNHRQYELLELQTLRDALAETGNISSAIELALQRQEAPATTADLAGALEAFDESSAASPPRPRARQESCCSTRAPAREPTRSTPRRSTSPCDGPASVS